MAQKTQSPEPLPLADDIRAVLFQAAGRFPSPRPFSPVPIR